MRGQRKNPRKAVQPFENKKRKIDIFKNYEANGVEKIQRKLEIFSTLISKKSINNLENYLDSDQLIFRYLEEKSFSKIKADYLLENHLNDSVSYLFIAKNNNCFVGISLFEKRMIRVSDKILENLRLNCEVFI